MKAVASSLSMTDGSSQGPKSGSKIRLLAKPKTPPFVDLGPPPSDQNRTFPAITQSELKGPLAWQVCLWPSSLTVGKILCGHPGICVYTFLPPSPCLGNNLEIFINWKYSLVCLKAYPLRPQFPKTPKGEVEFASSGHHSLCSSEAKSSGRNMFCPYCFETDGLFSHQGLHLGFGCNLEIILLLSCGCSRWPGWGSFLPGDTLGGSE